MRGRIPSPKGQIVVVDWMDACGYIGCAIGEAKPAPCRTVGWLMVANKDYIVIATSKYKDDGGDFTVLPVGMVTAVNKPE